MSKTFILLLAAFFIFAGCEMLIAQESSESGVTQRQATAAAGGQPLRRPVRLPFGPMCGPFGQWFDELIKAEQEDVPTIEQWIYCRFFTKAAIKSQMRIVCIFKN